MFDIVRSNKKLSRSYCELLGCRCDVCVCLCWRKDVIKWGSVSEWEPTYVTNNRPTRGWISFSFSRNIKLINFYGELCIFVLSISARLVNLAESFWKFNFIEFWGFLMEILKQWWRQSFVELQQFQCLIKIFQFSEFSLMRLVLFWMENSKTLFSHSFVKASKFSAASALAYSGTDTNLNKMRKTWRLLRCYLT